MEEIIKTYKNSLLGFKQKRYREDARVDGYAIRDTSDFRRQIRDSLDLDKTYVILRTVGNENLNKLLKDFKTKDSFGDIEGNSFNSSLFELFHSYLNKVNGNKHHSFPIVRQDTNCGHEHWDKYSWPVTHVVVWEHNGNLDRFKESVDSLLSDEAYRFYKKEEAPQNYQMPLIDHIFEKKVSPLLLDKEEFRMDGRTLSNVFNFLVQFEFSYRPENNSYIRD